MAVVAYAVVHGSDKIVTPCQTACECLELIKLLEAQAERVVRILDPSGAEMKLGEIEKLQRKEVERKYVVALEAPPSKQLLADSGKQSAIRSALLAATLLALAVLGLSINAISRHGGEHGGPSQIAEEKEPERQNAPPASPQSGKDSQTAGAPTVPQPSREASAGSEATRARTYRIVSGDTLVGIARKIYHDPRRWRDIAAANPGLDPNRLHRGAAILLPDSAKLAMPKQKGG